MATTSRRVAPTQRRRGLVMGETTDTDNAFRGTKNFVDGCFHCSKLSRRYHDKQVARTVLPLVPPQEWESLHWSPDELPASTGSKDLDNFFILRQIFLFLPFELDTLLAVAGTCRAWRILSDRLPHWRYILPMRNELPSICLSLGLGWVDEDYFQMTKYEKDYSYFKNQNKKIIGINDRHYKLKFTEEFKLYANAKYNPGVQYPGGMSRKRHSSIKDKSHPDYERPVHFPEVKFCRDRCCMTSGCSDCCEQGACKCSSCECSSGPDHEEVQQRFRDKKLQPFKNAQSERSEFLKYRTEEDRELSRQAIFSQKSTKPVDWIEKFKKRKKRRGERKSEMEKIQKELAELEAKNGSGGGDVELSSREPTRSVEEEDACYEADNDIVLGENDDDFSQNEADKKKNKKPSAKSSTTTRYGYGWGVSNDGNNDDDEESDERTDTDEENSNNNNPLERESSLDPSKDDLPTRLVNINYHPRRSLGDGLSNYTAAVLDGGAPLIDNQNLILRWNHNTLRENAKRIMQSTRYRQEYLFPSLSSFTGAVRGTIDKFKEQTDMHWFGDRHPGYCATVICFLLILVAEYVIGGLVGLFFDTAVGFSVGTDQFFLQNMSPMIIGSMTFFYVASVECISQALEAETKRATAMKKVVVYSIVYFLCVLAIPLSLVNKRIRSADILLDSSEMFGGEVSICNVWNAMNSTAALEKYNNSDESNSTVRDCEEYLLPSELLPKKLAESAFLKFPEGTEILYHPPEVSTRIVPFSYQPRNYSEDSSTTSVSPSSCHLEINAEIPKSDAGFNQTKTDVNRGNVGYYTVFFPSGAACTSASPSEIQNATVIILGDYSECPFWSSTSSSSLLHPRFTNIFTQHASAQALAKAQTLSQQDLINSILNRTSSSFQNTCGDANNLLISISQNIPHDFYLRVATGFRPHWSASYYQPRLPYNPENGGPWAERPYWTDTLEYRTNGIVALQADSDSFITHKYAASPVVPANFGDTEDANAFANSERTGGVWRDEGESPFWTAAHPAGIRRMRQDYINGAIGILTFVFGLYFLITFSLFFAQGKPRILIGVFVLFFCLLFVLYFPLLILVSICYSTVPEQDSKELTNPIVCLQVAKIDAHGVLIFAAVMSGLSFCWVTVATLFACCNDSLERCCEVSEKFCEEKLCDPVCEGCAKCCSASKKGCCTVVSKCCTVICDSSEGECLRGPGSKRSCCRACRDECCCC